MVVDKVELQQRELWSEIEWNRKFTHSRETCPFKSHVNKRTVVVPLLIEDQAEQFECCEMFEGETRKPTTLKAWKRPSTKQTNKQNHKRTSSPNCSPGNSWATTHCCVALQKDVVSQHVVLHGLEHTHWNAALHVDVKLEQHEAPQRNVLFVQVGQVDNGVTEHEGFVAHKKSEGHHAHCWPPPEEAAIQAGQL